MQKAFLLLTTFLCFSQAYAQHELTYQTYAKGSDESDTSFTTVQQYKKEIKIFNQQKKIENTISGYAEEITYADYNMDSIFNLTIYKDDESYYSSSPFSNEKITFSNEGQETVLGYPCIKYKTSINSNTIEVWMTEKLGFQATPIPGFGKLPGTMIRCARNGNYITDLKSVRKDKSIKTLISKQMGKKLSPSDLSQLKKEKVVVRVSVFNDEQIFFDNIETTTGEIPFDSVLHFSNGTVILKRIRLPKLPCHYQYFAKIHQQSNGDAYDRTASIFIIPTEKPNSLLNALQNGLEVLPKYQGKDGQEYQGIKMSDTYLPPIELVRFFTSFGAGFFNDRVKIDGLEWTAKNEYIVEVTDIGDRLKDEVLIGAFIGNYDQGGHKLSLELLAYPNELSQDEYKGKQQTVPIFNTCNVMEMSGQNYGRLFGTDSLTVEFEIPENAQNARLRYISTGHGGWDGGDEFNPKENVILIDGEKQFVYTPWRCDCATYREQNPVSGNFWNGLSSSDLSRSGWCPGTATPPTYFNLDFLKPGKHTITIAIPQGANEGDSFSHWMVSGLLIFEE